LVSYHNTAWHHNPKELDFKKEEIMFALRCSIYFSIYKSVHLLSPL